MINQALNIDSNGIFSDGAGHKDNLGSARALKRIRSMSWAPSRMVNNMDHSRDSASETFGSEQYLVVTDDADGVALLRIRSPWFHREQPSWEAQIHIRAGWESLQRLSFSFHGETAMEEGSLETAAADQDQWPSIFASSVNAKTFIESVTCVPCHSGLGLILRKDWQVLHFGIPYDVISQASTIDQWMPLSSENFSSSNNRCSSFSSSPTAFIEKVFPLF